MNANTKPSLRSLIEETNKDIAHYEREDRPHRARINVGYQRLAELKDKMVDEIEEQIVFLGFNEEMAKMVMNALKSNPERQAQFKMFWGGE